MLFGMEGLQVTDAESGPDGTLEVWAVTDHVAASACPDCGTVAGRVHEQVLTRPRDAARGLDAVQVRWVKRAANVTPRSAAARRSPSGCAGAAAVQADRAAAGAGRGGDRGARDHPAEAARGNGMSWPAAHQAFAAAADPLLEQPPALVAHLGIDEHRRGRPGGGWMRTPGDTSCSRTGGTPASPACPASKACWGRWRGAPLMTRHTGWRRPLPPDGTRSGSSRSTCGRPRRFRTAETVFS